MVVMNEDDISADVTPWLLRYVELLRSMDCRAKSAENVARKISAELFNKDFKSREKDVNLSLYQYLLLHIHRQRSFLVQKLSITDQNVAFLQYKMDLLRKQTFSQPENDNSHNHSSSAPNEPFLVTRASRAAHTTTGGTATVTSTGGIGETTIYGCALRQATSEVSSVTSGNSRHSRRKNTTIPNSPYNEGSKNTSLDLPDSPSKLSQKSELKNSLTVTSSSQIILEKKKSKNLSVFMPKKKLEDPWSGVCPACNQSEIGGARNMVACDLCDQWYHFDCVGYCQPPEKKKVKKQKSPLDEVIQEDGNNWYCLNCISSNLVLPKKTID